MSDRHVTFVKQLLFNTSLSISNQIFKSKGKQKYYL